MKKIGSVAVSCVLLCTGSLSAQEIDNTQSLPDARPGECYAKVITPAQFENKSEELQVREAAERIEVEPAVFSDVEEQLLVREESRRLTPVEAQFVEVEERVETRAARQFWSHGESGIPASPDTVEALRSSGVDVGTVQPGQCYREYYRPVRYAAEQVDVLSREKSERISVSEARFETVEERVMVKPATSEVVEVPAVFRVVTETVMVEPARSVWKKGRGLVERVDNVTGEILCLVEVPARYETISRSVLDEPATVKTVKVPPVYETYEVQRVVEPAAEQREPVPAEYTPVTRYREVADAEFSWRPAATGDDVAEAGDDDVTPTGREICLTEQPAEFEIVTRLEVSEPARVDSEVVPEEYRGFMVQKLESDARPKRVPVPGSTRSLTSRVLVEPSRLEWRKVLCETNITPEIVADLQRALTREGYDAGPVDGVIGGSTMAAVEAYQRDNGLDQGGLTHETLERLKVKI